jgi:hypothetical protein
MTSRSTSFHSWRERVIPSPGDLGQKALTCACCGVLSNVEHISASLLSLLHNSRKNTLILHKGNQPAVTQGDGAVRNEKVSEGPGGHV